MANKTYCFVDKKTYSTLKNAGKKTFPIHRFLETEETKEKAVKKFAKDTNLEVDAVKKKYHCFIFKPNKLHKIV